MLLYRRNLFRRHLNAKVAARYHHAVCDIEDALKIVDRLRLFELRDDPRIGSKCGDALFHQTNIICRANKRDSNGIDTVLHGKL